MEQIDSPLSLSAFTLGSCCLVVLLCSDSCGSLKFITFTTTLYSHYVVVVIRGYSHYRKMSGISRSWQVQTRIVFHGGMLMVCLMIFGYFLFEPILLTITPDNSGNDGSSRIRFMVDQKGYWEQAK